MNTATLSRATNSRSGLDGEELLQVVRNSESRLRVLEGATILITGATGWFGVWLLDALCTADDELRLDVRITAVSRGPERFLARFPRFNDDRRISWCRADVRQLELSSAFSHVIHAATDNGGSSGPHNSPLLFETIVEGTRRALAAAGPRCKSFLFVSSGAVYGPARADHPRFVEGGLPDAPDPTLPRNVYAEGKRAAEQACAIAAGRGLRVRIARCFAFVGPHMPFEAHFAIGNFIADAVRGRPIRVKSDGLPQRSYLYMTDLVQALIAILIDGEAARPYNVGSEDSVTLEQLARRVDRIVGGCGVVIEGAPSHPNDRYVPDTSRLRSELNWLPEISLDSAIARTAAWYRAHSCDPVRS